MTTKHPPLPKPVAVDDDDRPLPEGNGSKTVSDVFDSVLDIREAMAEGKASTALELLLSRFSVEGMTKADAVAVDLVSPQLAKLLKAMGAPAEAPKSAAGIDAHSRSITQAIGNISQFGEALQQFEEIRKVASIRVATAISQEKGLTQASDIRNKLDGLRGQMAVGVASPLVARQQLLSYAEQAQISLFQMETEAFYGEVDPEIKTRIKETVVAEQRAEITQRYTKAKNTIAEAEASAAAAMQTARLGSRKLKAATFISEHNTVAWIVDTMSPVARLAGRYKFATAVIGIAAVVAIHNEAEDKTGSIDTGSSQVEVDLGSSQQSLIPTGDLGLGL